MLIKKIFCAVLVGFSLFAQQEETVIPVPEESKFIYHANIPPYKGAIPYSPYLVPEDYKLQPGDRLSIHFYGAYNSTFQRVIPNTGDVAIAAKPWRISQEIMIDTIPFLGLIHLKNKTLKEIEDEVNARLKKDYPETYAEVEIAGLGARIVHIVGNVPEPGYYMLSPLTRISGALVVAGVNGEKTKEIRKIILKRNGEKIELNLFDYIKNGNLEVNPFIQNEDIILVP